MLFFLFEYIQYVKTKSLKISKDALREKFRYSEFFWSVFPRIRIECGENYLVFLRILPECREI